MGRALKRYSKLNSIVLTSYQCQDQAACDNGSDLSGNVDADGVHQQEILIVLLQAHLMYHTGRHGECGDADLKQMPDHRRSAGSSAIQHPVAHTKFIDDVTVISGAGAQLFSDIGHIDLQLFDASVIHMSPNAANDHRIGQHLSRVLG